MALNSNDLQILRDQIEVLNLQAQALKTKLQNEGELTSDERIELGAINDRIMSMMYRLEQYAEEEDEEEEDEEEEEPIE